MENTLRRITLIMLAVVAVALIFYAAPGLPPVRKPAPAPSREKTWYLINRAVHQVSTAYTEHRNAPVSASTRSYFIGAVAVHPKVPGGEHRDPIIPFGTVIMLEKPNSITIQGRQLNAFTVIDTGDADWALWPESPYWVDFFFGYSNYWNNRSAAAYGKKFIDYYWYEPFR